MLAEQRLRGAVHGCGVEVTVYPGAARALERRARAAIRNVVPIDPAQRAVPRMKPRRDRARPLHGDRGRQLGICPQHPGARGAHRRGVEVDDLTDGVNAGVGTAGANRDYGRAGDESNGILHRVLHGGRVRLRLPSGVPGAVVLDQGRYAPGVRSLVGHAQPGSDSIRRVASCFWLAEPSWTTSSRMLRAPSGSPISIYARARSSLVPTSLMVTGSNSDIAGSTARSLSV